MEECCWCGEEHPLNPTCNKVMGEHIADLEERDNKFHKRIAELEAEADVLRKECGKFSDRNMVALRERAKVAEKRFREVVDQFQCWGIKTSLENPCVMVNLLGDEREEQKKRAERAEAEEADITRALVRLQEELKGLYAPGKVAFLKSALAGADLIMKEAEAENTELRKYTGHTQGCCRFGMFDPERHDRPECSCGWDGTQAALAPRNIESNTRDTTEVVDAREDTTEGGERCRLKNA